MTDITTTRGRSETGAPTTYNQRAAAPTRWSADSDRTSVDFAVNTFWGLLTVRGHFDRFSGSYEVGPDGARIELTIDADSVDTGNAKRDEQVAVGGSRVSSGADGSSDGPDEAITQTA